MSDRETASCQGIPTLNLQGWWSLSPHFPQIRCKKLRKFKDQVSQLIIDKLISREANQLKLMIIMTKLEEGDKESTGRKNSGRVTGLQVNLKQIHNMLIHADPERTILTTNMKLHSCICLSLSPCFRVRPSTRACVFVCVSMNAESHSRRSRCRQEGADGIFIFQTEL